MVLAFARRAGPLIGVGIGGFMTGASLLWPNQTGPIFFYGGLAVIAVGLVLWVLGRWLVPSPKPAPTAEPAKAVDVKVEGSNNTFTTAGRDVNINYGPPRRVISQEMRGRVADVLRGATPSHIGFASTQGDLEAHEFKQQLMQVFREADWQVDDMQTFMFFGTVKGLVLTIPFAASEEGLPQVVVRALAQTGSPVAWNRGDMANECGLYVQVWHAP